MHYLRISDGQTVSRDEACDPAGFLRDGFRTSGMIEPGEVVSFSMAFVDSGTRTTFTDVESANIIARAKMSHDMQHGWMGDRAPAFTPAQTTAAINDAAASRAQAATIAAGFPAAAAIADAERITARAQMIERIANAWKN